VSWLQRLQTGDKAIIQDYVERGRVVYVQRLTPTMIVTTLGRFNRTTGRCVGSGFPEYLVQPTTSRMQEIRRFQLANRIRAYRFQDAPLWVLNQVMEVLNRERGAPSRAARVDIPPPAAQDDDSGEDFGRC